MSERPRLTEQEKKNNHIASEQKRRLAIREGFDRLTEIVPGLEGQGRSESIVLKKCKCSGYPPPGGGAEGGSALAARMWIRADTNYSRGSYARSLAGTAAAYREDTGAGWRGAGGYAVARGNRSGTGGTMGRMRRESGARGTGVLWGRGWIVYAVISGFAGCGIGWAVCILYAQILAQGSVADEHVMRM